MSYRKSADTSGNNQNMQMPSIPQNSKMISYNYIYDEQVKQMRSGFKKNKTYSFNSTQDSMWTVTAEFEHRMDLISNKFYNTSVYDWVLEDVNDITDPIKDVVAGKILIIPLHSNLLSYTLG